MGSDKNLVVPVKKKSNNFSQNSISQYNDQSYGLLTLGESKIIQLENGKNVELLPYLSTSSAMPAYYGGPRRTRTFDRPVMSRML